MIVGKMERVMGFEPTTFCLGSRKVFPAAGAGLPATNYRRSRPRLCARQGVGFQPPVTLACLTLHACLSDIKGLAR